MTRKRAVCSVRVAAAAAEEGGKHEAQPSSEPLTTFLASRGAAALLGWEVVLDASGEAVGTVGEVLRCGCA
jgi:hypothetical protein